LRDSNKKIILKLFSNRDTAQSKAQIEQGLSAIKRYSLESGELLLYEDARELIGPPHNHNPSIHKKATRQRIGP
jgi:hypothetical protein|tara:strand:+ start:640 stop:861 length:222 start_codon:yes stop_codon:yes gene_type:complete